MPALFKLKDHYKENQLYFNRTVTAMVFIFLLLRLVLCLLCRIFSSCGGGNLGPFRII